MLKSLIGAVCACLAAKPLLPMHSWEDRGQILLAVLEVIGCVGAPFHPAWFVRVTVLSGR